MKKKGQSATEFLSTYGIALVVIAVGVGAVFYLTSNRVSIPTQCQFTDPFVCNDLKITPAEATIDITSSGIQNGATVTLTVDGNDYSCGTLNKGRTNPAKTCQAPAGATIGSKDSAFSGTIKITYQLEGGTLQHTSIYTVSGTIEE